MGWFNNDGLYIKFGPEEGQVGKAGEYESDGAERWVELTLSSADITSADTILDYNIVIPKGAFITKVDVQVTTAFTGASSTLNLGGYKTDLSAVDATGGFLSGVLLASLTPAGAYQRIIRGGTGAGTYLGTSLASNVYLSTKWGTAAFTAGRAQIQIFYSFPT